MSESRPFRPWRFADPEAIAPATTTIKDPNSFLAKPTSVTHLTLASKQDDDRSQFVRFARASAQWKRWIADGTLVQEAETLQVSHQNWTYTICLLESLIPSQSSLPKRRDERQRLLEATQVYFEPILVQKDDSGRPVVIGNHDLYAAAKSFQDDMARPGKLRASDYALIAFSEIPAEPKPTSLVYVKTQNDLDGLLELGFKKGHHDSGLVVSDHKQSWTFDGAWTADFRESLLRFLGLRTLDLNQVVDSNQRILGENQVQVTFPEWPNHRKRSSVESPQDSYLVANLPPSGAIMWSLTDF
jgi:hypothetical protein